MSEKTWQINYEPFEGGSKRGFRPGLSDCSGDREQTILIHEKSLDTGNPTVRPLRTREGQMEDLRLVLEIIALISGLMATVWRALPRRRKEAAQARAEERRADFRKCEVAQHQRDAWQFMRQHPDRQFPYGWRGED